VYLNVTICNCRQQYWWLF